MEGENDKQNLRVLQENTNDIAFQEGEDKECEVEKIQQSPGIDPFTATTKLAKPVRIKPSRTLESS